MTAADRKADAAIEEGLLWATGGVALALIGALLAPALLAGGVLALAMRLGHVRVRFLAIPLAASAAAVVAGGRDGLRGWLEVAPLWRWRGAVADPGVAESLTRSLPYLACTAFLVATAACVASDLATPWWRRGSSQRARRAPRGARAEARALDAGRLQTTAGEGVPLGVDASGTVVRLQLPVDREPILITGTTRSGKTHAMAQLLRGALALGRPVVVLDLKGGGDAEVVLRQAAKDAGVTFTAWGPEHPARWNPLAHGDATEVSDKLVALGEWSEEFYLHVARSATQTIVRVLRAAGEDVDLATVARLLHARRFAARLAVLASDLPGDLLGRAEHVLGDLEAADERGRGLSGFALRLGSILDSELGPRLTSSPDGTPDLDLVRALSTPSVTYFALPALRYPTIAPHVASLVLGDLSAVASARTAAIGRGDDIPPAVFAVDEAARLSASSHLAPLVEQIRSARIALVVAAQELEGLLEANAPGANAVLQNSPAILVMRQNLAESATRFAEMIGTRPAWVETHQTKTGEGRSLAGRRIGGHLGHTSGNGTIREARRYVVHPDEIKRLGTGEAVLLDKGPPHRVVRLRVAARALPISPLPPVDVVTPGGSRMRSGQQEPPARVASGPGVPRASAARPPRSGSARARLRIDDRGVLTEDMGDPPSRRGEATHDREDA